MNLTLIEPVVPVQQCLQAIELTNTYNQHILIFILLFVGFIAGIVGLIIWKMKSQN